MLTTTRERECVLYKLHSISVTNFALEVDNLVPIEYRDSDDNLTAGNSSNPQFIFHNGEPVLLGILTNGAPHNPLIPATGRFLSGSNFQKINKLMLNLGSDYQLTEITIKR